MVICIFGDSITWGAYDPEQGGWATRLRNYFEAKDEDIQVYNLGISGDKTADLLNRIEVEAKSRGPNIILFAIGINDVQDILLTNDHRAPGIGFRNNLIKLCKIAQKFTKKIIFIGLTTVDESKTMSDPENAAYTNENVGLLDSSIGDFCMEENQKFISMNGVLNVDDLIDGLHPNTQGHKKMFEKIKREVESMILN